MDRLRNEYESFRREHSDPIVSSKETQTEDNETNDSSQESRCDAPSLWHMGWVSRKSVRDVHMEELSAKQSPQSDGSSGSRMKSRPPSRNSRKSSASPLPPDNPLEESNRVNDFLRDCATKTLQKVDLSVDMPWVSECQFEQVCQVLIATQCKSLVILDITACSRICDASMPLLECFVHAMQSLRHLCFNEECFSEDASKRLRSLLAERSEQRIVSQACEEIQSGNCATVKLRAKGLHDDAILVLADTLERNAASGGMNPSVVDLRDNDVSSIGGSGFASPYYSCSANRELGERRQQRQLFHWGKWRCCDLR